MKIFAGSRYPVYPGFFFQRELEFPDEPAVGARYFSCIVVAMEEKRGHGVGMAVLRACALP